MAFWEVAVRLLIAMFCGGVIGIERGKKNRPAGFRTYILVCVGASLTMILGEYLATMDPTWRISAENLGRSDVARFGAQVINGIGFLGAGTIIITGNQQVKGMTTAAGLWASACMGLCIGAGFYIASVICCGFIIFTVVFFAKVENLILTRSRNINLFIEFESTDNLSDIIEAIKSENTRIFDVEITKAKNSSTQYPNAIFSLCLPKKKPHTELMTAIAQIDSVRSVEEL